MPNTWTVKIHSSGNATPSSQHVANGDTVNFTSDQGAWTVTFDNGSPLPNTSYSGAKNASSGGVVSGTVGTTYKYTSCCTPNGGTQSCQDPDIVIDS
jgi:plastocyanin